MKYIHNNLSQLQCVPEICIIVSHYFLSGILGLFQLSNNYLSAFLYCYKCT